MHTKDETVFSASLRTKADIDEALIELTGEPVEAVEDEAGVAFDLAVLVRKSDGRMVLRLLHR